MTARAARDDQHLVTEALIERVLRAQAAEGLTWDAIADLAAAIDTDDLTATDDGVTWDDVLVAALALRADGQRVIPADVAERHLAAMHGAVSAPDRRGARALAWRRRVAGAAAAATAFTSLGGGAAVAVAQEAGPDDALYGVKLASEQVRLLIETDRTADARLHLQFAQRRLAELAGSPDRAQELVVAALEHLDEAEQHGDDTTAEAAQAVGQGAVDALTRLLDGDLPETASERARAALARNLERERAHQEPGATGRGQAPGRSDDREAPGRADGTGRPADAGTGERPQDAGPKGGRGGRPDRAGSGGGAGGRSSR